jgi:hypothetical protein
MIGILGWSHQVAGGGSFISLSSSFGLLGCHHGWGFRVAQLLH